MSLTPIDIARPTPDDKRFVSEFVGYGAARESANELARADMELAIATLARVERVIFWTSGRSAQDVREFEDTIFLHFELLRDAGRTREAAETLFAGRQVTDFSRRPEASRFLAEWLVKERDNSDLAMAMMFDHLRASKDGASRAVLRFLSELLVPAKPLGQVSEYQISRLERALDAWPGCNFALYGKALAEFHQGQYSAAIDLARLAHTAESSARCVYLECMAIGNEHARGGSLEEAIASYDRAWTACPDDLEAPTSLADTAAHRRSAQGEQTIATEFDTLGRRAAEFVLSRKESDQKMLRALATFCLVQRDWRDAEAAIGTLNAGEGSDLRRRLLLMQGKFGDALAVAEEEIRRLPQDLSPLRAVAEEAAASNQWLVAARCYLRLAALESDSESLRDAYVTGTGKAQFHAGQLSLAIDTLRPLVGKSLFDAEYWMARAMLRSGNANEAADLLSGLCIARGERDEFYFGASALAQSGRHVEAHALVRQAIDRFGDDVDLRALDVRILIAGGRSPEAEAALTQLERLGIESHELAELSAAIQYEKGDFDTAGERLKLAAGPEARRVDHLVGLGMVAFRNGQFGESEAYARRALAAEEGNASARTLLTAALARQDKDPFSDSRIATGALLPAARWILGLHAAKRGDQDVALDLWGPLLEQFPSARELENNLRRLRFLKGMSLAHAGKYRQAMDTLGDAGGIGMREDSDIAWVQVRAAGERIREGNQTGLRIAEEELSAASRFLGNAPEISLERGFLAIIFGDQGAATEHFEGLFDASDVDLACAGRVWAAIVHLSVDKPKAALACLPESPPDERGSRLAFEVRAIAYARIGEWRKASEAACALLKDDEGSDIARLIVDANAFLSLRPPDSAEFVHPYFSGLSAANNGQLELAATLLEQARRSRHVAKDASAALAEVLRLRGQVLIGSGELTEAASALGRATDIDPENSLAAELLADLQTVQGVLCVRDGNRARARARWLETLRRDSSNFESIRCLAVAHLFWAQQFFAAGNLSAVAKTWGESGMYWSMLLEAPEFHRHWAREKSAIYGREVTLEQVKTACDQVSIAVLRSMFATIGAFQGVEEDLRLLQRGYARALGEVKAADMLARAVNGFGDQAPAGIRVAGPVALARFGGLESASEFAGRSAPRIRDKRAARKLQIAYSGLAPQWELIEATATLLAVDDLLAIERRTPEQRELLAAAFDQLAHVNPDVETSFSLWVKAAREIEGLQTGALASDIESHVVGAAQSAASDWESTPLPTVRTIVSAMRSMAPAITTASFRNELANAMYGLFRKESIDPAGDWKNAETVLLEVLAQNPDHQRARRDQAEVLARRAKSLVGEATDSNRRDSRESAAKLLIRAFDLDRNCKAARDYRDELLEILLKDPTLYSSYLVLKDVI